MKQFRDALSNKDISALFELEKSAQEYNYGITANKDGRRDSLSALETMTNLWKNGQNPELIKQHSTNAHHYCSAKAFNLLESLY